MAEREHCVVCLELRTWNAGKTGGGGVTLDYLGGHDEITASLEEEAGRSESEER